MPYPFPRCRYAPMRRPPEIVTDRMTNPKIEALGGASGVQWASYRGVSLLLVGPASQHNPKRAAGNDPGICRLHTDPDAPLYGPLRRVLQAISVERLAQVYALAPVPNHALHVTAFDGVNQGNLRDVQPAYRAEAWRYLAGLPRRPLRGGSERLCLHARGGILNLRSETSLSGASRCWLHGSGRQPLPSRPLRRFAQPDASSPRRSPAVSARRFARPTSLT
jgi:hypothetical protein